jgi:lysophospholipase L1-like esterase
MRLKFVFAAFLILAGTHAARAMSLISRGRPAFASSGGAGSLANDADYNGEWRSSGVPVTLAYDLSGVPSAQRAQILLVWYNDETYGYDHALAGQVGYNNAGSYTIEANAATGGGSPPTSGWVTLATVAGNTNHSREHVMNFTGYNWIRMNATASDGSSGNADIDINMDVYDVGGGVTNGWFFNGDSITANCMNHQNMGVGAVDFGTQVATITGFSPPQENAGIAGYTTTTMLPLFSGYVARFPGRYVTINLGTNDAGGSASQFYTNLSSMVAIVQAAGKIAVVPTIPWAVDPSHQANIPALNTQIQNLYTNNPAVMHGPDLWTLFQNNPSLISSDQLHPTSQGCAALRTAWANVAAGVPGDTAAPTVGVVSPASNATVSGTISVSGTAADNVGVSAVQVSIDGGALVTAAGTTSWSTSLNTASLANGAHTLTAKATDAAGNATTTAARSFAVSNAASALAVHVSGIHLVDGVGNLLKLHGVNRSGTEYACAGNWGIFDGPSDAASVAAMASWGVNAVRVPLNADCWLGINGVQAAYGAANYQNAIQTYVNLLHQYGIIAIVDLHWTAAGTTLAQAQTPMPDVDHAPGFWYDVATKFKNDPAVIFDLYNEPYGVSWACLRDGCSINGYTAAGMQSLVNQVRAAGATNPIMIGGLQYANDLSSWLVYKPTDTANSIVASFHLYNFNACITSACWDSQIKTVAAQVPLVTGELGENDCAHGFIDGYMSWADTNGINYLGWAWNTYSCTTFPSLITDFAGTPTPFGVGLRDHFLSLGSSGKVPAKPRGFRLR